MDSTQNQNAQYQDPQYQGTPNQSATYQDPQYQNAQYQNNPYQNAQYQNAQYQNNPYQNAQYQNGQYQAAPYQNAPYQAGPNQGYYQTASAPVGQLKTNKGLLKFILLSIITFGIYGIVVMSSVSSDINIIAGRYDGKRTMHYCLLVFVISWLTLGIGVLVWFHKISARIGNELRRRGIDYSFGAGTFWGWYFLGSLIIVGPFIYLYKLFKSMNKLAEHYNVYG